MTAYVELYNQGACLDDSGSIKGQLLKRISVQKAMNMMWRGVARILDVDEGTFGQFEKPRALELVRYVYTKWMYERKGEIRPTRRTILRRDDYTCTYCGQYGDTLDHIQPRSRGGKDSWENLITACLKCNNVKDDRTPQEAGMKLRFQPRVPEFKEIYSWGRG